MRTPLRQRPYHGAMSKASDPGAMSKASDPSALTARQEYQQSERLDNFVDGAFAFAITLLVISGASLPRSVDALVEALRGVPAFAVCFVQLALFWHGHVRWRELLRLTDRRSLLLSLLLVFLALIFVFPLHLVYASFFNSVSNDVLSPEFSQDAGGASAHALKVLFATYGLSYACMGGCLWALFAHGARNATHLSHAAAATVRVSALVWAYFAAIGLLSMLIALCAHEGFEWPISLAGFSYALLGFTGVLTNRYRKHLRARCASADQRHRSATVRPAPSRPSRTPAPLHRLHQLRQLSRSGWRGASRRATCAALSTKST